MKKIYLKDLQLSPKVVTDLTGSGSGAKDYTVPNVCTDTETCNQSVADTCKTEDNQCLSEVDNPCATDADCNNETKTCNCGTDTCTGTLSAGEQCCYATKANASQCCISPPASHHICLETDEGICITKVCNETTDCNQSMACPITDQCEYTDECVPTEVNCYQPVETIIC